MTRRGWLALGLAGALYLAAWAFGSRPLYPVALGLAAATALSWALIRFSDRPIALHRVTPRRDHYEGDDVVVDLELETVRRLPTAAITVVEHIDGVGERATPFEPGGERRSARYVLRSLPRGLYRFAEATAVLEDPFGLQRVDRKLSGTAAIAVFPRLAEVERLFSEGGAGASHGRRRLLHRPVGYDVHGVREHAEGESLRRVHWPSTAKRGQLMVKELEDSPRDEVAVLLDAQRGAGAGRPPDSSFDLQVRAAGSILRAHARRGRRTTLLVNGATVETVRVQAFEAEWRNALEALAAAAETGNRSLAALLADSGPSGRARELVAVTGLLTAPLVDRLVQRAAAPTAVALVYVDAATFNGAEASAAARPLLLRLGAAGVPVCVLRRGDDLAERLGPALYAQAAHG